MSINLSYRSNRRRFVGDKRNPRRADWFSDIERGVDDDCQYRVDKENRV